MTTGAVVWTGLGLALLAAFLLSLFHVLLGSYSKISLSRVLETRDKGERARILGGFEETRLAVEFLRAVIILALVVYGFTVFQDAVARPIWLFLAALAVYALLLDLAPRLLVVAAKPVLLRMFLPAFPLVRVVATPLLLL